MHWRKRKKLRRIAQHHGYKHWHSFNKYTKLYRIYYRKYNDPTLAQIYTTLDFYNNKLKSKYNTSLNELYKIKMHERSLETILIKFYCHINIKFTLNDEILEEVSI